MPESINRPAGRTFAAALLLAVGCVGPLLAFPAPIAAACCSGWALCFIVIVFARRSGSDNS